MAHDSQTPTDGKPGASGLPASSLDDVGDPVCWLSSVCPECGRLAEDRQAEVCPRCGADLPD